MAAVFHGNVEISGDLTVQELSTQSLNQRLSQLAQQSGFASSNSDQVVQRITALDTRVDPLQQQVNSLGQQFESLR